MVRSAIVFLVSVVVGQAVPVTWVQSGFDAFAAGKFDDSGVGLYVSHQGAIKSVNRFDLNNDGFLDLVFNSSHDERRAILPTVIEVSSSGEKQTGSLPVYGTTAAAIADLNGDGYPEAVFLPNDNGTTKRRQLSIFWADATGWSGDRRTNLWTMDARALAVGDLNGDGYPDLAILNGSRWAPEDGPEAVVRIYWGSREGFRHESHCDLVVPDATDIQVTDIDRDSHAELLVLQTNPGRIVFYGRASASGLIETKTISLSTEAAGHLLTADLDGDGKLDLVVSGGQRELLPVDPTTGKAEYRYSGVAYLLQQSKAGEFAAAVQVNAPASSAMAVADLDGDGYPEIVLADRTQARGSVHVLWSTPDLALGAHKLQDLDIGWASALAIGDVNGDGKNDLVVGTARSDDDHRSRSAVFFGDGRGEIKLGFYADTAGVGGVALANIGSKAQVLFCNAIAGRIREDIPVTVYWGGADGFGPERTAKFSIRSGYASLAADLNGDGWVDLVLLSIVHANSEDHPGIGFNILWGGPDGLKNDRRTVLREYGVWGLSVADLNRDGWLDLIGNCNHASPTGEPQRVVVWYGGALGFSPSHRDVLPVDGAEGQNLVADFDRDGFLDIAVAQERANLVTIFYGSARGFSSEKKRVIPLVAANDMKTADLNRDGWLDLVVTSHKMADTSFFDFGTTVFWGSPNGFSQANARQIPGQDGIGICIADWDLDGWLDIFLPGYHYGHTREGVSGNLFWGGSGGFDDLGKTELLQDGGHGAMAADFDGDGRLDLAIACHTRNGTHETDSLVYFGDGKRFKDGKKLRLPTVGPHFMSRADVGNLYDRSYRQGYTSVEHTLPEPSSRVAVRTQAKLAGKTKLELFGRAAISTDLLTKTQWRACDADGYLSIDPTDRVFQYRAVFVSDNGDRYPELSRVEVTFEP